MPLSTHLRGPHALMTNPPAGVCIPGCYYDSSFVCVWPAGRPAGCHTGVTLMSRTTGRTVTMCRGVLKMQGSTFLDTLSSISMSVSFHGARVRPVWRHTLRQGVSR